MFYGDAFAADKIEAEIYGVDLTNTTNNTSNTSSNSNVIIFNDQEKVPDCKQNQVSFLPFQSISSLTKNTLAISKNYICYTVKNKQIRVIHQFTTEKSLLSGHHYQPLDMLFNNINPNIICTCDINDNDNNNGNVYIWTMDNSNDVLTTSLSYHYNLPANIIASHNTISNVWAIGYNNHIAIISTSNPLTSLASKYDDLSLNGSSNGLILDLGFTHNNNGVFALFKGANDCYLDYWALPSDDLLEKGDGKLTKMFSTSGLQSTSIPMGISAVSTPIGIVTLSSTESSVSTFDIKVWKVTQTGIGSLVQTVTVDIPLVNNDPAGLVSEASLVTDIPDNNFVIFAHRRSRAVACLALNPKSPYVPIVHVTFLDLTNPLTFVMARIATGRNHHSEEEVDHLDISCTQILDKSIINQYLIPVNNIRKPLQENYNPPVAVAPNPINFSSSLTKDDGLGVGLGSFNRSPSPNLTMNPTPPAAAPQQGRSILSMLMGGIGIATPPAAATAATPPAGADVQSLVDILQSKPSVETFPPVEPAPVPSVPITHLLSSLNANSSPLPTPPAADGLPDILKTGPVQNRSLLQMVGGQVKTSVPAPPILSTPEIPPAPKLQISEVVEKPITDDKKKTTAPKKIAIKEEPITNKTLIETNNTSTKEAASRVTPITTKAVSSEVTTLSKDTIKALKNDIVADVLKGIEVLIQSEMKKAVDNIKKSLKDELGKQISLST